MERGRENVYACAKERENVYGEKESERGGNEKKREREKESVRVKRDREKPFVARGSKYRGGDGIWGEG